MPSAALIAPGGWDGPASGYMASLIPARISQREPVAEGAADDILVKLEHRGWIAVYVLVCRDLITQGDLLVGCALDPEVVAVRTAVQAPCS